MVLHFSRLMKLRNQLFSGNFVREGIEIIDLKITFGQNNMNFLNLVWSRLGLKFEFKCILTMYHGIDRSCTDNPGPVLKQIWGKFHKTFKLILSLS